MSMVSFLLQRYQKENNLLLVSFSYNEEYVSRIKAIKGRKYVSSEQKISEYVMNNKDNAFIIKAPSTLISFGIK